MGLWKTVTGRGDCLDEMIGLLQFTRPVNPPPFHPRAMYRNDGGRIPSNFNKKFHVSQTGKWDAGEGAAEADLSGFAQGHTVELDLPGDFF